MDINNLLSGLLGNLSTSDAAIRAERPRAAATTAGIEGAATNSEAYTQQAIAQGTLANQQMAEIERRKLAAGETAQRIAGLDPDDINNFYVQSMADLTATRVEREAALAEYRKLTETSFLDNPVGYIFNQLALPQVVQKHNNLATQQDAIANDLDTATSLMYQNKTQVTANVASATKEAKLTAAAANEAAAKATAEQERMKNFGAISAARMNEVALLDKVTDNASKRFGAVKSLAEFQALERERALAHEERRLRMAAAAKDKEIKDAQDSALAEGLARVSGALGYPVPVSLDDFNRMPASKAKQRLWDAAINGTYGDNLAESIDFLRSGNLIKMQEQDPAFVKGLTKLASTVRDYATAANNAAVKAAGKALKPDDAARAGASEFVLAATNAAHDPRAAQPLNDPYWDGKFMPYRSQDLTMIGLVKSGKYPQLANNSYVKVLETAAEKLPPGTGDLRGEDRTNAIKTLATLVSDRKIPLGQAAADLVAYNRAAAAYNQDSLKLASLGFEVQESAYVRIPGATLVGKDAIGDTLNPAGAENLLETIAANTLMGRLTSPANPAMAIFGGAGAVGVLATQSMNKMLDITPEK